jgi:hypothetical protein
MKSHLTANATVRDEMINPRTFHPERESDVMRGPQLAALEPKGETK